jgi:opine dehydrogenase
MRIAVLGGGHGAYATAADLALRGHAVSLWRRTETELGAVRQAGGITLVAEGRPGKAQLARATADLGEAVGDAEVIVVPLPATTHEDLARRLAPHLRDSQIVLLTPGTFGAYALAREIARAGGTLPYAVAETGTLPYLARKTGPAEVKAAVRAANLPTGVLPAARSKEALAKIATLFSSVRPCVDALDAALTNAGPVIHPPLVLLNAGAIDQGRFDIHGAGTMASARRLIDAVDGERLAARRGWGYPAPHYEIATYDDESGHWNEVLTFEHRYVREDVVLGLSLFESAARTVSVASPATSGLLLVFETLLGQPLSGQGRALEHLGLGDLLRREIRTLLQDGWLGPIWSRAIK